MPQVRIAEIMTRQVEHVAPDDPFAEVARRMVEGCLSCLVVCRNREPVGVISERDLAGVLAAQLGGEPIPKAARDVMSSPAVSVYEDSTADEAMACVLRCGIRRLVVVDAGHRLAGLVTQTDLLHARTLQIEKQRSSLARMVSERTQELQVANQQLQTLSLLDGLLEIGNRRAMESTLDKHHAQANRYERPYAVALLDVDYFKSFNDHYGHPEADRVLQRLVTSLSDVLRGADSLYRYGGEEILMLLPETSGEGALQASERARGAVEALGIAHRGSPLGVVTVSVGAAVYDGAHARHAGWAEIVERADAALYRAKRAGRNRVEVAPPGSKGA